MPDSAVFARDAAVSSLIEKLKACKSVFVISEKPLAAFPHVRKPIRRLLTLKELLDLWPACAHTVDENVGHDRFVLLNNRLIIDLTPESDNRLGFVTNEKMKAKGHYEYDLNKKLNKRVLWVLDNTATNKYEFAVYTDPLTVLEATANQLDIAVPQLDLTKRKRRRDEDDANNAEVETSSRSDADLDLDLLEFDDWASEIQEWAGLAVLNPRLLTENNGGIDREICNYFHPENAKLQSVTLTKFDAPLMAADVLKLWNILPKDSWCVLIAVGMPQLTNQPISDDPRKPAKYENRGILAISTPTGKSCISYGK